MSLKWRSRSPEQFNGNLKEHIAKSRGISDVERFLDPPPSVVHSPLLLKNIEKAMDRVMRGIENNEKIAVFADPDPDGIIATVLMVDYLKMLTNNVRIIFRERETGHGINIEDVDENIDLLIIVDSSSSEFETVNKLSKDMDIIIFDHHNIEKSDKELNAILVNPRQEGCQYPNKNLSGSGVVFKFIELIDYHYKKVNVNHYLDLVATSLLSDQMDMSEGSLENRFFVKRGLSRVHNLGLLALLHVTRNHNKKLDATIMGFDIIPVLNTATRNNEMKKAFALLFERDFFKAKRMASVLVKDNKKRKEKVKNLFAKYDSIKQDEKFIYITTPEATKNYNGLVAQKFASIHMKPALVLKDDGEVYQGSYRSYNGFDLQTFLKKCPYVEYAAGHSEAGGVEIKHENWNKFKQYVDENIDEAQFEPIIEYDIEIDEDELDWDLVREILEFDTIWGNGADKITVRLNNVFVEDKEIFPPQKPEHVKIVADNIDLLKFNDKDYASEISDWMQIDVVGAIGVNTFKGVNRVQLYIEDFQIK